MTRNLVTAGLALLAATGSAQVASKCASNDVCFKLNIPEKTASSGNGDIFFQISAPSDYEWVALGLGSRMSGSNIFAVYTSKDGKNVTLSPRLANGYTMPKFNGDAEATLLEGSGISNGKMVANVRCSNCHSWSGGSADFTAGNGNWIYAYQSSKGPKNSNDQNANIQQHSQESVFRWDYASAKGGNSVNPLLNTNTGGGTPTQSCIQRSASKTASPTQTGDDHGGDDHDDDDDNGDDDDDRWSHHSSWPTPTGYGRHWDDRIKRQNSLPYCDELDNANNNQIQPISGGLSELNNRKKMLIAHGVLACLAFAILFPAGAITIRLASFPGLVWFHAAFQIFAYLTYTAAFGLGIYMASQLELTDAYHPIIGIVIFIVLLAMPVFGFLHHALYKKYKTRTAWSYLHLWVGRTTITLGIINGGLGFKLADSMRMGSRTGMIVYAVVAGVVWVVWVVSAIVGERRRKRAPVQKPEETGTPRGSTGGVAEHPAQGHYAPK